MPPVIDAKKCTMCGICQDVCPGDILYLEGGLSRIARYPDECQHCDICRVECPEDAITIHLPWTWLQTPKQWEPLPT